MISGVRLARIIASPPRRLPTAAVAIVVRGHSALTATPALFSSADSPSTHMLMPNLAMVYAVERSNHFAFMSSGGDNIRMCGFSAFVRCGMQYFDTIKVPRVLMPIIRSNRFMSVAWELVRLMALALLTQISIPPNSVTVLSTAAITWASSRISQMTGIALPPAARCNQGSHDYLLRHHSEPGAE